MTKPSDYWMGFWSAEIINVKGKRVFCYGYSVVDDDITSLLVENPDGTRVYDDDPDLIAAALEQLSIQPYKSETKRKKK